MGEEKRSLLRRLQDRLRPLFNRLDQKDAEVRKKALGSIVNLRRRVVDGLSGAFDRARKILPFGPSWIKPVVDMAKPETTAAALEFATDVNPVIEDSVLIGRQIVDTHLSLLIPEFNPEMVRNLAELPGRSALEAAARQQYISGLSLYAREQIAQEVTAAVVSGASIDDLARAIEKHIGKPGVWRSIAVRARMIARTELARSVQAVMTARMEQLAYEFPGWDVLKLYVAQADACPRCAPFDGRRYRLDGTPYTDKGAVDLRDIPGSTQYKDPKGSIGNEKAPTIPQHPLCRCSWVVWTPNSLPRKAKGQTAGEWLLGDGGLAGPEE